MSRRILTSSRSDMAAKAVSLLSAICLLFSGMAIVMVATGSAQAQEENSRQVVQALRERVFQYLAKAQELMEAEDYAGAKRELDDARGVTNLNSYELGSILYFSGLVEYQRDNLAAAVDLFEKAVALPDLPQGFRTDTIWALVQLAMAAEEYRKVLEYGNEWLRTAENPSGDPFYLLAVAHYQLKEYRKTVEMMDRAIEIAERDGDYAREDWYGLLRAGLHELSDTKRLRNVLELLVARWPKKEYWIHLSAVYGELNEERKQLAALEVIYEAGWMTRENELLQLAQLYMQRNGAYKGARIIEKAMEKGFVERNERNYRLLAQAWIQAQDDRRSIPPLREAAQLSNDGQLYLQLAQSYLNLYEYGDCVEAARTALRRGGLRRAGYGEVVLGTCLLELKRYEEARDAFSAARTHGNTRRSADRWLEFIDREVARKRDLDRQLERLQSQ